MNIRRTNQGGSVAQFVIVGIILAVVLIGAVYYLNQHSQQVRKDQQVANQSNTSQKPTVTKTKKNTTKKTSKNNNLPATGPEMNASQIFGVYLLTFVIVGYIMSRRKLALSL